MNAVFAWKNHLDTAVLGSSNYAAGLDPYNLRLGQGSPSTAWQTTAGVTAAALLVTTPDDTAEWGAFLIARTNLTSAATIRWVTLPDTGTSYNSGYINAGVSAGFGQSVHVPPAVPRARRMQMDVSDPTNPDGFLNIPLMFCGPRFIPQTNISWDSSFGRDDQVDEIVTRGGQEYPAFRWARRRWEVSMQGVRASEVWPSVMEMDRVARRGGNVLFIPDPLGANVSRETVYGRGRPTSDLTFPSASGDRRAYKIRVTERL